MNLTTDPWIPVLRSSGDTRPVSLREVFEQGHIIADLAVRPHERIALMRLLICIAQAALDGPEDLGSWEQAPSLLPAAAERYLVAHAGAFNLFDPVRPFLQIVGLKKNDTTPTSKLDFALATGNNSTLFDNAAAGEARKFTGAELALMLLAFQCFSVGGRIGVATWAGKETPGSGSSGHAPCTPGSMLHSFIRRDNLLATICSNLLSKSDAAVLYSRPWGRPVWEQMPASLADSAAIENATGTFLGRLAPLSRAVLLLPGGKELLLANGLHYPSYPEGDAEPSATIIRKRDNDERFPLGAGAKAVWRQLAALVVKRKAGTIGGALTLTNISDTQSFDLWVGALQSDKASILDTVESLCHVPAQMLTDAGRAEYDDEVQAAERKANALGSAIVKWRELVDGGWPGKVKGDPKARGKLQASAARYYWSTVERSLPYLQTVITAEGAARESARDAWRKSIHAAALTAFESVCSRETPRQLRAFAVGRAEFFRKPKALEPTTEAEE